MRTQTNTLLIIIALFLASTVHVFGLAGSPKASLPNTEELQNRIESFYSAEKNQDWKSYYGLMDLPIRSEVPYEQFFSQVKFEYQLVSWKVAKIEKSPTLDQPETITAKVSMDVIVQYPGEKPKKAEDQTDYWVYRDGHWFWSWRGWPDD